MANRDNPSGLSPVKYLNGTAWNGQANYYLCDSGDNTVIGVGDIVLHAGGSGAAGQTVSGVDCEGMATITRATTGASDTAVGVVVGFLPLTNESGLLRAASTNRIALVCDDPFVIFSVQEDALVTPIVAASVGLNVAFTVTAASTTTGLSGMEIDSDTVNTTATLPLRIIGLDRRQDNAFNTAGVDTDQANFLVKFNIHRYLSTTGI